MITFWNQKGMIYQHVILNKKINGKKFRADSQHYLQVLKTLRWYNNKKRLKLENWWTLHHDNARPHTAHIVQEYLELHNIEVLSHSSYLLDLAMCDFWIFPMLKKVLCGCHFVSDNGVVTALHTSFNSLDRADFQKMMVVKWAECIKQYIKLWGQYFEEASTPSNESDTNVSNLRINFSWTVPLTASTQTALSCWKINVQ